MDQSAWKQDLRFLVSQSMNPPVPEEEIADDTALAMLGLDSLGTVGLLVDIEEHFQLEFPEHFLLPQTFETYGTLERVVKSIRENTE